MYVKKNMISIFYFIRNKANSITVVKYVMNLLKKNVINFDYALCTMLYALCFMINFSFITSNKSLTSLSSSISKKH